MRSYGAMLREQAALGAVREYQAAHAGRQRLLADQARLTAEDNTGPGACAARVATSRRLRLAERRLREVSLSNEDADVLTCRRERAIGERGPAEEGV